MLKQMSMAFTTFLYPLLQSSLSPRCRCFVVEVSVDVEHPIICCSLNIDQLQISAIISSCCRKELLCRGMRVTLFICEFKSSEWCWKLHQFLKEAEVGLPLWSLPDTDSWLGLQQQVWIPLLEQANYILVGYPLFISITIILLGYLARLVLIAVLRFYSWVWMSLLFTLGSFYIIFRYHESYSLGKRFPCWFQLYYTKSCVWSECMASSVIVSVKFWEETKEKTMAYIVLRFPWTSRTNNLKGVFLCQANEICVR